MHRFLPKYILALAGSVFLFSVGWLRQRHRFLIYQIAVHFGYPPSSEPQILPTVAISHVLPGLFEPRLLEIDPAEGNVTTLELAVLTESVRRSQPSVLFEIGTFDGRTTLNLAANAPTAARIHTLDLPASQITATRYGLDRGESQFVKKESSGRRFVGTHFAPKIIQLFGDSATFDFLPFRGGIDWFFIDGSHAYDYVRSDTARALASIRDSGGIIFWHDYQPDWPGVIRALNELQRSEKRIAGLVHIEGTTLAYCEVPPLRS
jgi:hypothetical protein